MLNYATFPTVEFTLRIYEVVFCVCFVVLRVLVNKYFFKSIDTQSLIKYNGKEKI